MTSDPTSPAFRTGRRLGIDWGDVRIGVAASDPEGRLAFAVQTVPAGDTELTALAALVAEYEPIEVVVGLPRSLNGTEGPAATKVRARATALAELIGGRDTPIPVRLVDERLSTVQAVKHFQSRGKRSRDYRQVIDQAAAQEILDHALTSERRQGVPPGELVSG